MHTYIHTHAWAQTLYSPVFTSMELDAAGRDDEPPLVYRTDTVGGLSSTSASSLALQQSPHAVALDAADATRAAAATPVSGATREGNGRAVAVAGGAGAEEEQAPAAAAPRKSTAASKVSRFEQLVLQSFEEVKKRSPGADNGAGGVAGGVKAGGWRWAARGRRAWLRLTRNVVMVMNSRSTSMVRAHDSGRICSIVVAWLVHTMCCPHNAHAAQTPTTIF